MQIIKTKATTTPPTTIKHKNKHPRPPPLANELALMQFLDGGSMEDNFKRITDAQNKSSGTIGRTGVYRDGNGSVWRDQDEKLEYTHLLADSDESRLHTTGDLQWVTFDGEKRDSVFTLDQDLDPMNIVQPTDVFDSNYPVLFGSATAPPATTKPGMSVLAVPCRPGRAAKHLQEPVYLVDAAIPQFDTYRGPELSAQAVMDAGLSKPMGRPRRRPEPRELAPSGDLDNAREEYFETNFKPVVPDSVAPAITRTDMRAPLGNNQAINGSLMGSGPKKTSAVLNTKRFF